MGLFTPGRISPIKIAQCDATQIHDIFDQALKDHAGDTEPYTIPLLLNNGGNHWINAAITVTSPNKVTISVTDSLGIDANKKASFERVFAEALPGQTITSNIEISKPTQTDGWSCGYRAVTSLLRDQFPHHDYPDNAQDLLKPNKSSADLRDGIFKLLGVKADASPLVAPSRSATIHPDPALDVTSVEIEMPERRESVITEGTVNLAQPVSMNNVYLETVTQLLGGTDIQTWATELEKKLKTLAPPCDEKATVALNSLASKSEMTLSDEQKQQLEQTDYIMALRLQLEEIKASCP